ncbi:hypothetical protein P9196_09370 [Xylella fastidiosa subsp. multiplex]|nr:hypothetical protein [Xylella fastidiosa]MDG4872827.1 hypothetical protein [Xylella fastidiosa subsp. multiplex]
MARRRMGWPVTSAEGAWIHGLSSIRPPRRLPDDDTLCGLLYRDGIADALGH